MKLTVRQLKNIIKEEISENTFDEADRISKAAEEIENFIDSEILESYEMIKVLRERIKFYEIQKQKLEQEPQDLFSIAVEIKTKEKQLSGFIKQAVDDAIELLG